jgi:Sister chromatid cohesion protein Dcc1
MYVYAFGSPLYVCCNCRVNIVGGGESEEAVIVTSRETFKMTRVETSNTVLLLPAAMDHSCQTAANSSDDAAGKSHRYIKLAHVLLTLTLYCSAMNAL